MNLRALVGNPAGEPLNLSHARRAEDKRLKPHPILDGAPRGSAVPAVPGLTAPTPCPVSRRGVEVLW